MCGKLILLQKVNLLKNKSLYNEQNRMISDFNQVLTQVLEWDSEEEIFSLVEEPWLGLVPKVLEKLKEIYNKMSYNKGKVIFFFFQI